MESVLRARLAFASFAVSVIAAGLTACSGPSDTTAQAADESSAVLVPPTESGAAPSEPLRIDTRAPYAGQWAAEHSHCEDDQKKWTIEPHRMAIVPAMRFCTFESVYVNQAADAGETSWSAGATCLAEGRESHDFLFFRLKENLREMRVTFNDSRSVQLYRCIS